jgi:hypothetical protein
MLPIRPTSPQAVSEALAEIQGATAFIVASFFCN